MKPLLAIIGGLFVSLGMFVSGAAVATYFLYTEPAPRPLPSVDVSDLWTGEPRTVNTEIQPFERLPAQIGSDPEPAQERIEVTETRVATDLMSAAIDPITTASAQSGEDGGLLSAAHVEWCANRYRSYRPGDNSFTPYSGGKRPCVSPYSSDLETAVDSASPEPQDDTDGYVEFVEEQPLLQYASDEADGVAYADSDHVAYCFSRYRSYRPEDNSYQPYGGGPRRQCR